MYVCFVSFLLIIVVVVVIVFVVSQTKKKTCLLFAVGCMLKDRRNKKTLKVKIFSLTYSKIPLKNASANCFSYNLKNFQFSKNYLNKLWIIFFPLFITFLICKFNSTCIFLLLIVCLTQCVSACVCMFFLLCFFFLVFFLFSYVYLYVYITTTTRTATPFA